MLQNARDALAGRIEAVIAPLLVGARRVCLIDLAGHPNVGDSAIVLGELDFLSAHLPDARLSFFDVDSYSSGADRLIGQADLILIHGGGNFGDIWTHHHDLRLRILQRFPGIRTVQFPQSISFSGDEALDRTRRLIDQHSDFTLIVRDVRSEAFARSHFDCRTSLSPDMAFAMFPITRRSATVDCFALLRTDKEVRASHAAIQDALAGAGLSVDIDDWLQERPDAITRLERNLARVTRRLPAATAPFGRPLLALRRRYAEQRLAHGIELLSRGRVVVTDRLHAMIISTLLSIPVAAFDSFDGKISAFVETWLGDRAATRMVGDAGELGRVLPTLLAA